jgi:hypothetical protein
MAAVLPSPGPRISIGGFSQPASLTIFARIRTYVAAGRFDGFWELKLMPWDTAAGWLLITEAGGVVTDLSGGPYGLSSPHMLAGNGIINDEMLRILSKTDPLYSL